MSSGKSKAECIEAIEGRLGDLEAVGDALWESLDCRVMALEAERGVGGSGNNEVPQVKERLAEIESSQRQLGDAIKTLTSEVKEMVATLRSEIDDLATSVKVITKTVGKSPQEGDASESKKEDKVSEPKGNAGETDADLRARLKLRRLKQTGSLRDYVKEFTRLVRDVKDMTEKDQLHAFLDGLPRQVAKELQWMGVQDVQEAVKTLKRLPDYDTSDPSRRTHGRDLPKASVGQSGKGGSSKSGGVGEKRAATHLHISASSQPPLKKSKTLECFFCGGPHKIKECPQTATLTALQAQAGNQGGIKTLKCFFCGGPHKIKECPQTAALAALQAQLGEEAQAGNQGSSKASEEEEKSCKGIGSSRSQGPQE